MYEVRGKETLDDIKGAQEKDDKNLHFQVSKH